MKLAILVGALACACATHDPHSGVPAGKLLLALDSGEVATLCAFIADHDPVRDVTCGDKTLPFGTTQQMCIQTFNAIQRFPTCPATVQDAERCFVDIGNLSDADSCKLPTTFPASCATLNGPMCD